MNSVLRRRAAWFAIGVLAFVGLPNVWSRTLLGWVQFGASAPWKWPVATVVLLVLFNLLCGWLSTAMQRPLPRWALVLSGLAWVGAHGVCWRLRVSPLGDDPLVMLAYLGTTAWLGWCGARFFVPRESTARLGALVLLLAPLALWFGVVESHGADGHGRPIVAWRFRANAKTVFPDDGVAAGPVDQRRPGRPSYVGATSSLSLAHMFHQPATGAGATAPRDYPCFRGSAGLASIEGVRLAHDWSARPPRLIWRKDIGAGWGGFATAGTRAYTQEQRGDFEAVACYDLATGHECWVHVDRAAFRSAMGGDGPRATPAVADGDVNTLGATGILNCLDAATGRRRWSIDVLADNGASNLFHGLSGSPLIVGDTVVVSTGGPRGGSLAAYDRRTGERLFSGGNDPAGYGSPLFCKVAGQHQILVFNRPGLAAHDPQTGKVLWTFAWSNGQETNCSQPLPLDGGHVLVSTGYGKGSALIAVRHTDETWSVEAVWTGCGLKCKFCSPVVRERFAYGLDDGVLACLDLADGRRRWRAGRYGHGQVLLVGDVLLIQAESGEVVLAAATPDEHRELGRFAALEGKTWNYPALAGSLLLVRNDREAACFELPVEQDNILIGFDDQRRQLREGVGWAE